MNTEEYVKYLKEESNKSKRRRQGNYFLAYSTLLAAVGLSFAASTLGVMGWDEKFTAVVAAIPGFLYLLNSTFRFEARAAWHRWKRRRLERAWQDIEIAKKDVKNVYEGVVSDIATHHNIFPSFGNDRQTLIAAQGD